MVKSLTEQTLGLKEKPKYEDVIDYISRDPDKIKYPNRKATQFYNSFLNVEGQNYANTYNNNLENDVLLRAFASHYNLPYSGVAVAAQQFNLSPYMSPGAPASDGPGGGPPPPPHGH